MSGDPDPHIGQATLSGGQGQARLFGEAGANTWQAATRGNDSSSLSSCQTLTACP